ncbi:unnamed protein product, partial [Rotaria magnacalcarata]
MSPRNQYTITSDSTFLQTNNQVFVFTTQLANEAADAIIFEKQTFSSDSQHHNGNGGPPPNWPHPHFHPSQQQQQQQQPPFGRLTPGPGGLPPPSHILPPGALMMNGQPPSDGIENLTPERAKHRKNQLNKIEDLKTKITGGRSRGGRTKGNAAATAAA